VDCSYCFHRACRRLLDARRLTNSLEVGMKSARPKAGHFCFRLRVC
jgi:hypothetical protein